MRLKKLRHVVHAGLDSITEQQQQTLQHAAALQGGGLQGLQGGMTNSMLQALSQMCKSPDCPNCLHRSL